MVRVDVWKFTSHAKSARSSSWEATLAAAKSGAQVVPGHRFRV